MASREQRAGRLLMLDIVFILAGIGFFGLLQLYTIGCAHLLDVGQ